MDAVFEQRVRERAYEIWKASGMGDGAADRHWLSAEKAMRVEADEACAKPVKAAKTASSKPEKPAAAKMAKGAEKSKPPLMKAATPRKSVKAVMSANA